MSTKHLTDEQLANLKHLLRVVISHSAGLGHGHMVTIEPHGDAEALFFGRGEPLPGMPQDGPIPYVGHGLNMIHLTEPSYQWPDVRAFIVEACNSIEPLLDMLVEVRRERDALRGDTIQDPNASVVETAAATLTAKLGLGGLAAELRAWAKKAHEEASHWKRAAKVTGIPVDRAKVVVELYGDPEQWAKHADALMTAIEEYGNYKYLPKEHHKNCPYGPPQVDEETGKTFQNQCACGYEAFHALKQISMLGGAATAPTPMPIVTRCPQCTTLHIDEGEWVTRPHRTHLCAYCKHEWRPMNIHTVGVAELP